MDNKNEKRGFSGLTDLTSNVYREGDVVNQTSASTQTTPPQNELKREDATLISFVGFTERTFRAIKHFANSYILCRLKRKILIVPAITVRVVETNRNHLLGVFFFKVSYQFI